MKICSSCGQNKDLGQFYKNTARFDGLQMICKECAREGNRKRTGNGKAALAAQAWRIANPEHAKKTAARTAEARRISGKAAAHSKAQRAADPDVTRARDFAALQRRILSGKLAAYCYNKRRADPQYRILHNLRSRVWSALKAANAHKRSSTVDLLGCTIQELRVHLENQFAQNMSWDNQGKWHIDHIRPCASFDLTSPEQQKICFHFTNLQPLWAIDNLMKGARIAT